MENVNKNGNVIRNILSQIEKPAQKKDRDKLQKITAAPPTSKFPMPPTASTMKAMSWLAHRLRAQKQQTAVARDAAPPEPLDATNLALSQAILRKDWNDDERLEPELVLDYIREVYDTDDIFVPVQRNINGTVLIVVSPETEGDLAAADIASLLEVKIPIDDVEFDIDPAFPYIDQPSVLTARVFLSATGFQIGKNIVATAGHVTKEIRRIQNRPGEFGPVKISLYIFRYINDMTQIKLEKISRNVEILDYRLDISENSYEDWGLLKVELTRRITPLETDLKSSCGQEVYCLGHGLGLPLKMSWYGMIFQKSNNKFVCKLETFAGNSGSPVFDATTHKVIGIVSGATAEAGEFTMASATTVVPASYMEGYDGATCTTVIPIASWLLDHIGAAGL